MTELSRTETAQVLVEAGRYSMVVINALRDPSARENALRLIDSDIAKFQSQMAVAKVARAYITDATKADRTVTPIRRDAQS